MSNICVFQSSVYILLLWNIAVVFNSTYWNVFQSHHVLCLSIVDTCWTSSFMCWICMETQLQIHQFHIIYWNNATGGLDECIIPQQRGQSCELCKFSTQKDRLLKCLSASLESRFISSWSSETPQLRGPMQAMDHPKSDFHTTAAKWRESRSRKVPKISYSVTAPWSFAFPWRLKCSLVPVLGR